MSRNRLKLGVNIDHVATLRQARGTCYPDPVEAARICEQAGADGITLHLREDRRHIQDADLFRLRPRIETLMNLEMACNPDVLAVALKVLPDEVCLVPERREELTTEGGLDVAGQSALVAATVDQLKAQGIVVSLFIDPEPRQIEAAAVSGATVIELHTGVWCESTGAAADEALDRLRQGASLADRLGLKVNAGHGLTLDNLAPLAAIPELDTLNIGHSIISRAVFIGLEAAVQEMLAVMAAAV